MISDKESNTFIQRVPQIKVTVCELRNEPKELEQDWKDLVAHAKSENSDLVLLPEMPFYPWIARTNQIDDREWQKAVETHERWIMRLGELKVSLVAGTCPIVREQKKYNEGFVWNSTLGYQGGHCKYYLPNQEDAWEASWYDRGNDDFSAIKTFKGRIGFLICTELWFNAHAREYGKQGVELLVTPRATVRASVEKWLVGGRAAAVVSGAYSLSSNYSFGNKGKIEWGGSGWIIEPQDGHVLGVTSREHPFLTMDIDLHCAQEAKQSYPRNVVD